MEIELKPVEERKRSQEQLYCLREKETGGGVHTSANLIFGARSSEVGQKGGHYDYEKHPHDLALPKYYGRDTSNVQICILVIGILLVCSIIAALVITLWMFSSSDPPSAGMAINLIEARKLSVDWLESVQYDDRSWYPDTPTVVTALQTNDISWLNKEDYTKQLSVLQMNNEILAILKDSARVDSWEIKSGTTVPVKELPESINTFLFSSYINALVATCQDPTDFYGENLLHSLQYNLQLRAQSEGIIDYATAVLALCNGGLESYNDLKNYIGDLMDGQLEDGSYEEDPIESTAMVAMALSCAKDIPSDVNESLNNALNYLVSQQKEDGTCGSNMYINALSSQVFNVESISETIKTKWNQSTLLDWLRKQQGKDGSYSNGNVFDTSTVLVALAQKFIGAVKSTSCLYTIDSKGKEMDDNVPITVVNINLIINDTRDNSEASMQQDVLAEKGWSVSQVLEEANLEYKLEENHIISINKVENTNEWSWSVLLDYIDPQKPTIEVNGWLNSTYVSDNEDTITFYYTVKSQRRR